MLLNFWSLGRTTSYKYFTEASTFIAKVHVNLNKLSATTSNKNKTLELDSWSGLSSLVSGALM